MTRILRNSRAKTNEADRLVGLVQSGRQFVAWYSGNLIECVVCTHWPISHATPRLFIAHLTATRSSRAVVLLSFLWVKVAMCDRAINWRCRVVRLLACRELVHLSIQRNCSIIYIDEARIISAVEYWGSDCVVVKLSLNRTFNRTRPDWHFLLRKFLVFYRWPWWVWRRLVCIVRGWVGSRRFVWSVWPDLPSVLSLSQFISTF